MEGFALLERLSVSFSAGRASDETLQRLQYLNDILFARITTLTVPRGYLVDADNRLRAIYRGPVPPEQVVADAALSRQDPAAWESAALPFPSTWVRRPVPLVPVGIPADLATREQFDDAEAYVKATLEHMRRQPMFAPVAEWLGNGMLERRRSADAAAYFRESLALDNGNVTVMNNLAYLLSASSDDTVRNGTEALRWAQRAVSLAGSKNPSVLDTLAVALAENGDFPEAATAARRALDLARRQNNDALATEVETHLKLFLARRPLRDGSL
jgi:tetratricopeptide (TPR) repeat protein